MAGRLSSLTHVTAGVACPTQSGTVRSDEMPEASLADLAARNRERADAETERALLRARHEAFLRIERGRAPEAAEPGPAAAVPADPGVGLPVTHGAPSAELVRDAIAAHGSLVVRGLIDRARAESLRGTIETALAAREAALSGQPADPTWYSEFVPIADESARDFTSAAGMLAADSPRGHFLMSEALYDSGVVDFAAGVFGTRPALSVEKSVLRRVEPGIYASWHQDGAFLGERISTLDVWIALTRCGRTAPGLEIFPRRVDRVLPTGAFFDWDLSDETLAQHYPGVRSVMPEFDVGDAIIFDQLCVHRSGYAAGMTNTRFAVECWLFAPASVPATYTGLLL